MEKINIAELLKDCPKGMELDCTMFEDVKFDYIKEDTDFPIRCVIENESSPVAFNKYGQYNILDKAKCVIFPKGKTTWEGFKKPFKDGDIIFDGYSDAICIFRGEGRIKGTVDFYCGVGISNELFIKDVKDRDAHFGYIDEYNLATEKEKQKLFYAIQDNGYKWDSETKSLEKLIVPKFKEGDRIKDKNNKEWFVGRVFEKHFDISSVPNAEGYYVPIAEQDEYELVPNKFDINTLKPFESKVLVRDIGTEKWRPAIWGFSDSDSKCDYLYKVVGGFSFSMCIPYNGNEHLLGKTKDCNDFYKTWK